MIEIKKPGSALNLNKTTKIFDASTLNNFSSLPIGDFSNNPILFITIENNSSIDFTNIFLEDAFGNTLTHHSAVNNGCYSIAFSGNATGQPLQLTQLSGLSIVNIFWTFPGTAGGSTIVNIYTFAI